MKRTLLAILCFMTIAALPSCALWKLNQQTRPHYSR